MQFKPGGGVIQRAVVVIPRGILTFVASLKARHW